MSTSTKAKDIFVSAQQNELAAKIIDGLDRLDEKLESSAKRWIWELIQNAKDASLGSRPVQIEVIRTAEQVEFKHSGNPFTLEDLVSIICQTSLKERSEDENEIPENTGKFGTGFITTHLLSRVIEIKGIYKSFPNGEDQAAAYQHFNLVLDRATTSKQEMIKRTIETQKIFENLDNKQNYPYLESYELGQSCDTSFIYPLDNNSREIADQGIHDFKNSVFQVMVFNPQIRSIRLIDKVQNTNDYYTVQERRNLSQQLCWVKVTKNEHQKNFIQALKDQHTSVCLELVQKQQTFQIVPKPLDAPILYADFPLIGSEHQFTFPCYLNSHTFWPNEERSSIQILNKPRYNNNKKALRDSVQLIAILFKYAIEQDLDCLHYFALIKLPSITNKEWFRLEVLYPIMTLVANQPIVQTFKGRTSLMKVIFPSILSSYAGCEYRQRYGIDAQNIEKQRFDALWSILLPFHQNNLIVNQYDYAFTWKNLLHSEWYEILPMQNNVEFYQILEKIHSFSTLSQLQGALPSNPQEWRQEVYQFILSFISQDSIKDISHKYKIFLNQKNEFCYCGKLFIDQDIEEVYKDICKQYGWDISAILLSKTLQKDLTIHFFDQYSQTMTFGSVAMEILTALQHNPTVAMNQYNHRSIYGGIRSQDPLKLIFVQGNSEAQTKLIKDMISLIPREDVNANEAYQVMKSEKDAMYGLIEKMIQLPAKRYTSQFNESIYNFCESRMLEQMTFQIENCAQFSQLKQIFGNNFQSDKEILYWLNAFYQSYQRKIGSIYRRKVILNQQLVLCCCYDEPLIFDHIKHSIEQLQTEKIEIKDNLKKILNKIRELYKALIDNQFEAKLIHPDIVDALKNDVNIVGSISSIQLKDVLNKLDSKITNACKNIDYIKNNNNVIFLLGKIYNCMIEDDDILSSMLPQFKSRYKEIMFECLDSGQTKEIIVNLCLEGGGKIIENLRNLDPKNYKIAEQILQGLGNTKKSPQEIQDFLEGKKDAEPALELKWTDDRIFHEFEKRIYLKNFNTEDFFGSHCICTEEDLESALKRYNPEHRVWIKSQIGDYNEFEMVIKMLRRSVQNVKTQLGKEKDYDISNWKVETNHINQNIIGGVKKHGAEIKIVIRPTDNKKIIFHNKQEIDTLKMSDSEIWGDNNLVAREFMFGEIIAWNGLFNFSVYP